MPWCPRSDGHWEGGREGGRAGRVRGREQGDVRLSPSEVRRGPPSRRVGVAGWLHSGRWSGHSAVQHARAHPTTPPIRCYGEADSKGHHISRKVIKSECGRSAGGAQIIPVERSRSRRVGSEQKRRACLGGRNVGVSRGKGGRVTFCISSNPLLGVIDFFRLKRCVPITSAIEPCERTTNVGRGDEGVRVEGR